MIDSFLIGWYTPELSARVGRYGYVKLAIISFAIGLVAFLMYVLWDYMFCDGRYLRVLTFSVDGVFRVLAFPIVITSIVWSLRWGSPLMTWPEAQDVLKKDGYIRQPADEENIVIYEKGPNRFVARVSRRKDPESIEWWHKGEKRGDVILKRAKGRYVP